MRIHPNYPCISRLLSDVLHAHALSNSLSLSLSRLCEVSASDVLLAAGVALHMRNSPPMNISNSAILNVFRPYLDILKD